MAYAAERSTFDGSLPENAPPPWRAEPPQGATMVLRPGGPGAPPGPPGGGVAAVGVDDDLAAGEAGVTHGTAGDEAAGRVHEHPGVRRVEVDAVEHRLDDLGLDVRGQQLLEVDVRGVLGGEHHGLD